MAAMETLATIFGVLVLVKMIVLMIKPEAWIDNVAKPFLKHADMMKFVYLALAIWAGYYIFQVLTIVEVTAVALFVSLLMALGFFDYPQEMLKLTETIRKKGISRSWMSMTIWTVWAVWVLWTIWG